MDQSVIDRVVNASLNVGNEDLCQRVPRVLIDPHELDAAERMLDLMIDELRLPKGMLVGWFRTFAGPADLLSPVLTFDRVGTATIGLYRFRSDPYMVWIRAGIGPRSAATAVAHEARHAFQFLRLGGMDDDKRERERDAYEYTFKLIERFSQR